MKVAYVPFKDKALVGMASETVKQHNMMRFQGRFESRVRRHSHRHPEVLRDVGRDQELYIIGHGSPCGDLESDDGRRSLGMRELAERLRAAGLSRRHRVVKLYACKGALGDHRSMSARLLRALRNLGYRDVTVYGYTENLDVTSTRVGQKTAAKGRYRASDVRVAFGA